jgi:fumarate reductase flavoprotein subunit
MALALDKVEKFADPDRGALEAAHERAFEPLGRRTGDLEGVRRKLFQIMWDDAGILRSAESLNRAQAELSALAATVSSMGTGSNERRFNLTWMDRLNLKNLILVSRAICVAAQARTDSCGAHFREDFPKPADPATARYTVVRAKDKDFSVTTEPVNFTHVRPGQTLLTQSAE